MTRDEIVLLARESLKHDPGYAAWTLSTPHLEMIVNNAIKAEREACAKLCEEIARRNETENDYEFVIGNFECAAAIRARGNT